MEPGEYPAASAVGADIPDRQSIARPEDDGAWAALIRATPQILIRHAIDRLRGPDGRGGDRHESLAISALEDALLRLNAADVL